MVDAPNQDRYLALSGGGFDAHSAHAGWIAGGMEALAASRKDNDLDQLLGNVRGLASSSGGSWFSSMLAFSNAFRAQFESKTRRDAYNSSGYNGQLRQLFAGLFDASGRPRLSEAAQDLVDAVDAGLAAARRALETLGLPFDLTSLSDTLRFVAAMADNTLSQSGFSWRGFVDQYVYKPMALDGELGGLTLASPRNPWANDVDVVIGGVLQTSPVVLGSTGSGLDIKYGQVSLTPIDVGLPSQLHFTPISLISSAPSRPVATSPASALLTAGPFKASYTGLRLGRSSRFLNNSIPSQLSNALSLIDATTISSAAAGVAAGLGAITSALPDLLREPLNLVTIPLSDTLRAMAPASSISNGVLAPLPPVTSDQKTLETAVRLGAVRLADSGYVDNSSVGYLLRQIQTTKGTSEPFSITVFMNSTEAPDPVTGVHKRVRVAPDATSLSSFGLSSEVVSLFGQSRGDGSVDADSITMALLPVSVPSAQLFDPAAWYGQSAPDWSYSKGSISLSYHDLDVTTVDNKTFGIQAGQSGKLHVFTAFNSDSGPAPANFRTLDEYAENYDVIRDAVANQGGFAHLQAALGLSALSA
ncbi:MAG: hypothetical protein VKM98_06735 [Cyanobacteriota bacterium]|nr:hypothetical protein [Cyanobacteriota bacterium]